MLKDILKILENDARITIKQISTMAGVSKDEVAKAIKYYEEKHSLGKIVITIENNDKLRT